MKTPLNTKAMFLDISSMRSRAMKLLMRDNEYNDVLKLITNKENSYFSEEEVPKIKDLAKQLGMRYERVRRHIHKIYKDLTSDEGIDNLPFNFKDLEIEFRVKSGEEVLYFKTSSLPVIPSVGDKILLPYFTAILGTEYFYISEITHNFLDTKQSVEIELNSGRYNSYWKLRKDQALYLYEIPFKDQLHKSDREIVEKLRINFNNAW